MSTSYMQQQRENASRWKAQTATLPDAARVAAPYVGRSARPGTAYPFCLPAEYAGSNLLPHARETGLAIFAEHGIPWHDGIAGGPSNHLLSSQVQCVNALAGMVHEPARLIRAFGGVVDIAELLEIEPGRHLTFEYIGPKDYLHESRGGVRVRGAHCTSVDAAFRYRTRRGRVELALVEWKFTESYLRARRSTPARDEVRASRYQTLYEASDGPLRPAASFALMLDEPFYQLMRQQLLAHELERDHAEGATRVRVLHVLDPANVAYQASVVRPPMKEFGDTVDEIWSFLLRSRSRFRHVDPAVFLDPAVTSDEYVARYSPAGTTGSPQEGQSTSSDV